MVRFRELLWKTFPEPHHARQIVIACNPVIPENWGPLIYVDAITGEGEPDFPAGNLYEFVDQSLLVVPEPATMSLLLLDLATKELVGTICIVADIDPSHLHRFVHGTGRLTNDTIDRLVPVLGLRLVSGSKKGR